MTSPTDIAAARKALEREKRALTEQKEKWPLVLKAARALADLLEENHFSEKIRHSWESPGHEPH